MPTIDKRRLGYIGLGIMGAPMAGHLLRAGHSLAIHTRTRAKAAALLDAGASWCGSPAEVAIAADLVFLNVPDSPDVEAVLFGPRGLADSMQPGSIIVDFSTIAANAARSCAERLKQRGIEFLDAPVTGGQIGAKNATLTIMVGGDAAAFQYTQPFLELMGKKIVHVGPSGAGQALKSCNQILCAVNMIGVCEALKLAAAAGLDLAQAIETLGGGAGGSWAWTTLGGKIVSGDLQPAFMIKLMQKDLRIVQEAATAAGVELPGTALAQKLFESATARHGGSDLGTQAMWLAYQQS